MLAVLLVLAGSTVAVAGAMPQAYLTPTQALSEGPGRAIAVKGVVVALESAAPAAFTVGDGEATLRVAWAQALPPSLAAGRTVAVHGELTTDEQGPVLVAHRVEVGCPSRYTADE